MRQSIRGFADAEVEEVSTAELARTAGDLEAVSRLLAQSDDLRLALTDPAVPVPSRRSLMTDLLGGKVTPAAMRLIAYAVDAGRAQDLVDDVAWMASRVAAAARGEYPVGEPVLGRSAAFERLDGYTTGVLQTVERRETFAIVEDELFRFVRVVEDSPELAAALTSRDAEASERRGVVTDLLQGRSTPEATRLAAYSTRIGRARDYLDLLAHAIDRLAAESNRRLAEVKAPIDLDDAERRRIGDVLSRVAGRTVEVRVSIDPSVLAGFVATIGDTVVDGSARHRLELLKERLEAPEAALSTGGAS